MAPGVIHLFVAGVGDAVAGGGSTPFGMSKMDLLAGMAWLILLGRVAQNHEQSRTVLVGKSDNVQPTSLSVHHERKECNLRAK